MRFWQARQDSVRNMDGEDWAELFFVCLMGAFLISACVVLLVLAVVAIQWWTLAIAAGIGAIWLFGPFLMEYV